MKFTKLAMLILIVGMLISVGRCNSIELDGFSIGATYLNTNITTINSINAGPFGKFVGKQKTKVEGLMPMFMFMFNFKFK